MAQTMKITDVIAHPLSVAYERASWTAHEYMDRAQLILLEVRTDQGLIGFGEVAGGSQKQIYDLVALFADVVEGMDPMGHAEIWSKPFSLTSPRPGGLGGSDGMPPLLPRNLRPQIMAAIGGMAYLHGDEPVELDVRVGGKIQFRHSPGMTGAT